MSRRCRTCKAHKIPKEAPKSQWWCSLLCRNGYTGYRIRDKPKVKAKPKKKLKSIARVVDDCALLLQRLVRLKAADSNGYAKCVTCGKVDHLNNLQGGHLIERGKTATKLVEENVHPQCGSCNGFGMKYKASVVLEYRRYMVGMYGEELVRDLEQLSKQPKKYSRQEVQELSDEFKRQIKEQETRLGIT